MFYRPWQTVRPDPARSAALSAALGMPRLVCDVMCARGLDTPEAARAMCGGGDALSDPMLLSGMEAAVARIHRAIDDGERIAVFGDYDVDGVTATALLYTYLDSAGADVYYKLPSRDDDGYGLSETAVDLMAAKGVSLIVTVDNGVSANAAIAHAKEQGVDVVVTDHHLPPQTLPEAAAIVNPQLPGDESPCKTLSGAGVAFKLAAALDGCTPDEMLPFYGDLAAIGTIADIMLLEGENRRIVKAGLALLQQTERPGIAALIETCGLGGKELTAENVSFGLAPRLNAAGRMDSAAAALELLLCEDPEEAEAIVAGLEAQNAARQKAEQDILQGVLDSVAADETYGADRILVVWGRGYHQGVIGIVASRMAEEYSCPTFLICLDGDKGKASSRSYGGFNLFRSLEQLSGLLESYGGHELAAGFTIRRESIAPFREKMMALCARFRESDACSTALAIDCEIPPELLTIENIQALGDLEPCGAGCPRPILCMRGLHVTELTEVGGGKHLRLRLSKGAYTWGAIFFSTNAQRAAVAQGDVVDIAFTPQINEYRSVRSVQLNLVDIRPDKAFREAQGHDRAVYKKHLAGGELSCDEAECLLPTRQDFVAVWRYLAAFSQGGVLSEELGCLSRKISRCAKLSLSAGKTRICLDVLAEQGLLQLEQRPKSLCIRLCANGRKVDLEKSPILIHLKKQKAGT